MRLVPACLSSVAIRDIHKHQRVELFEWCLWSSHSLSARDNVRFFFWEFYQLYGCKSFRIAKFHKCTCLHRRSHSHICSCQNALYARSLVLRIQLRRQMGPVLEWAREWIHRYIQIRTNQVGQWLFFVFNKTFIWDSLPWQQFTLVLWNTVKIFFYFAGSVKCPCWD